MNGKDLRTVTNQQCHIETVHAIGEEEDGASYICETCGRCLRTESNLQRHIKAVHIIPQEKDGSYICQSCGKSLSTMGNVRRHVKTVHTTLREKDGGSYICEDCGKCLSNASNLQRHIITFHTNTPHEKDGGSYICQDCGKCLSTAFNLQRHITTVHITPHEKEDGSYICDLCGKCLSTASILKRHIQTVHITQEDKDGGSYKCEICGKYMRTACNLHRHIKSVHATHEKDGGSYYCPVCGKCVSTAFNLQRHIKTVHTTPGEKNVGSHACDLCGRCYSRKDYLHHHMKTVHAPPWFKFKDKAQTSHKCDVCCKCFSSLSNLLRHVSTIHSASECETNIIKCDFCGQSFWSEDDVRCHISHIHKTQSTQWPLPVNEEIKRQCVKDYRLAVSAKSLSFMVCAVCGQESHDYSVRTHQELPHKEILAAKESDLELYKNFGLLLVPEGINQNKTINCCSSCLHLLNKGELPATSIRNDLQVGKTPTLLLGLTLPERMIIALYRTNMCVVTFKLIAGVGTAQGGVKGNTIIFPQDVSVATKLPMDPDRYPEFLKVLMIGSKAPSKELLWKYLTVRRKRVVDALQWLIKNHDGYKNVTFDHESSNKLPEDDIPDSIWDAVTVCPDSEADTAEHEGYVESTLEHVCEQSENVYESEEEMVMLNTGSIDVSGSTEEIKEALLKKLDVTLDGATPIGEYNNPEMWVRAYPHLFPYGHGGAEIKGRTVSLSLNRWIKHLLKFHDHKFRKDAAFLFFVFNVLQKREVYLQTSLRIKRKDFNPTTSILSSVASDNIKEAMDASISGNSFITDPTMKHRMQKIQAVGSKLRYSTYDRQSMRQEIQALMINLGMPAFFVTLNPTDVHSPLVCFLAGEKIDVDQTLPDNMPNVRKRAQIVAENPVEVAEYFHIVIEAFFTYILRYGDPKGGAFGIPSAYYSCMEEQGKGTLHIHILIWVHGYSNPTEMRQSMKDSPEVKERLLQYLDSIVKQHSPKATGTFDGVSMVLYDKSCENFSETHEVEDSPVSPVECRFPSTVRCDDGDHSSQSAVLECDPYTLCNEISALRCGLLSAMETSDLSPGNNSDIQVIKSGCKKGECHGHTHYCKKPPNHPLCEENEVDDFHRLEESCNSIHDAPTVHKECRFGVGREKVTESQVTDSGEIVLKQHNYEDVSEVLAVRCGLLSAVECSDLTPTSSGDILDIRNDCKNVQCDKHTQRPQCPDDPLNEEKKVDDLHRLVESCNTHHHTNTCYKYGHKACRFGFEREKVPESHVSDSGEILLKQLSGMVNNYEEVTLMCLRSSMDVKFGFCGKDCRSLPFYLTDYQTKMAMSNYNTLTLMTAATKALELSNGTKKYNIDMGKRMVLKCFNRISTETEMSAAHVASFLSGHKDIYTSHTFRSLNIHEILAWTSHQHNNDQTHLATSPSAKHSNTNSSMDMHDTRDSHLVLSEFDAEQHSTNLEDQNVSQESDSVDMTDEDNDDKNNRDSGSQVEVDNTNVDEGKEMDIDKGDGKIVEVNQRLDYIHRGDALAHLCLYDYVANIEKLTKYSENKRLKHCSTNRGRVANQRFQFSDSHPQAKSHLQRYRSVPIVPMPSLFPTSCENKPEKFYKMMLILFKPFTCLDDLQPAGKTWEQYFRETNFSDEYVRFIKHIEEMYAGMSERKLSNQERKQDKENSSNIDDNLNDQDEALRDEVIDF